VDVEEVTSAAFTGWKSLLATKNGGRTEEGPWEAGNEAGAAKTNATYDTQKHRLCMSTDCTFRL
jgi:hypothetical protein